MIVVFVSVGQIYQYALQLQNMPDGVNDRISRKEPDIERHLVVAAARGMQFFPHVTDLLNQAGFDINMNVFQFRFELESALGDLFPDAAQARYDFITFGGRDDALFGQHAGVRDAAGDIIRIQPPIIMDRRAVGHSVFSGFFLKAAAYLIRHLFLPVFSFLAFRYGFRSIDEPHRVFFITQ